MVSILTNILGGFHCVNLCVSRYVVGIACSDIYTYVPDTPEIVVSTFTTKTYPEITVNIPFISDTVL